MRAWRVVRYGQPTEAMELQDIPTPTPGPGEVLVRTAATVLNYNDVDGCRGRYITVSPPIPYTLGMEVVGQVEAAGPGAEVWLGRRVMASAKMAYGGYAEQVIAPAAMTFDAPAALDDREAAAFFFPFHLAWLGLHERGGLKAGDSVLVHAGAGGVGSAAIQLAAAAGARVIATAGGPDKLALCRALGAEVAIDYRKDDFEAAAIEATGGRGVDLVFDGVGGEVTAKSMRCLAANGRLLVIGFAGGIEAEDQPTVTPRVLCFGSVALVGVMLAYAPDEIPRALNPRPGVHITPRSVGDRVQSGLLEMLAAGKIRPVIGETIAFEGIPAGLDRMEQRLTTGRVVALV